METTSFIIYANGAISVTAVGLLTFIVGRRAYQLFSNMENLAEEFVGFHENSKSVSGGHDETLATLSHTYRALKKQEERTGRVDKYLLNKSLEKLKDRKKLLPSKKEHRLYHAAWKEFKELEKKASNINS